MIVYRSCRLKRRNVSNKSFRKTKKKHFLRSIGFFIVPFCEIKWNKDGTAEQATDENTAHALCMLDTYGYKHTHRTCHIYWFSKEIIVSRSTSVLHHVFIAFLVPIKFSVHFCLSCKNYRIQRYFSPPNSSNAGFHCKVCCW
jgi:hypothetical protein